VRHHITEESWRGLMHQARLAAERGESEFMLLRFPSQLCGDGGRAVNAGELHWPTTLRGEPAEIYLRKADITCVEADDRPRMVGRRIVPTRWQGRCCDYREVNRCRIPTRAVVSWLLEDGPLEYWRGTVTAFGLK
jgi:hypothetical protein